jgi:DNA-binding LacI/PurR family transcriptional regulator
MGNRCDSPCLQNDKGGKGRQMAVKLRDVARAAGVSPSAVSRSFTEGAPIAAETRARVLATAARLGYRPNRLAASLTTGRTRLVGLIADDFANPFFPRVFDLFTRGLQDIGLRPLLVNLTGRETAEDAVRLLQEYSVEAAILVSATLPPTFGRAFRAAGIPAVLAFARASAEPDCAQAGISDAGAGRLAARTLAERGYRRLGFIGGPERSMPTRDRVTGFRNMAARLGLPVAAAFAPAWSYEAGRAAMATLMAEAEADGIFCADDMLAIGALSALRAAGRRVPDDVGVLGLDDIDIAGWDDFRLTTIAQPVAQIVAAAIELAAKGIADPLAPPEGRQLPCLLIERDTLRPLP